MALIPVRYSHAATTATRIATCQARIRQRSEVMGLPRYAREASCIRSARLRLRLAKPLPPRLRLHLAGHEFLAEGVPDLTVLAGVLLGLADADHVAGARELDGVDQLDAPGPARHHHHPV